MLFHIKKKYKIKVYIKKIMREDKGNFKTTILLW